MPLLVIDRRETPGVDPLAPKICFVVFEHGRGGFLLILVPTFPFFCEKRIHSMTPLTISSKLDRIFSDFFFF